MGWNTTGNDIDARMASPSCPEPNTCLRFAAGSEATHLNGTNSRSKSPPH